MDRAELEERRHARGAVEGWVVAPVAVVRQVHRGGTASHASRAAASPASGSVAVIGGSSGIGTPSIVFHSTVRGSSWTGRLPAVGQPRPVERGEHLVRLSVRLADPIGGDGVRRSGRDQRHLTERGGDASVALGAVGGEVGGDVDGGGTRLGDHRRDHRFRSAATYRQCRADRRELRVQGTQGSKKVREPGPAGRPEQGIVEHEQRDHRPLPSGRDERGMVVETQVASEPQDGRSTGRWHAHRPCPWCWAAVTGSPESRRAPISSAMCWVAPAPARASGATAASCESSPRIAVKRSVVVAATTTSSGRDRPAASDQFVDRRARPEVVDPPPVPVEHDPEDQQRQVVQLVGRAGDDRPWSVAIPPPAGQTRQASPDHVAGEVLLGDRDLAALPALAELAQVRHDDVAQASSPA